jgi:hypothetical protein
MTETAIMAQPESRYLVPAASITQALARYKIMDEFTSRVMVKDHDYGIIPGTDKPTLLKPGAEKLNSLFGLTPTFEPMTTILDVTGLEHGGEPFILYQYKCRIFNGAALVAEGIGSCNSWEKKYRYRQQERTCPACHKATIIKGKAEYGGGYVCFTKKGGCGAKFKDGDPAIVGQATGQVKNPDISELINTLDKMAQKRALIAGTLIATNASDHYNQDLEDFTPTDYVDAEVKTTPAPEPEPAQPSIPTAEDIRSYWPVESPVSFEQAILVKSTEGMFYVDLPSQDLSYRTKSLNKHLLKPSLKPEEVDDIHYHLDTAASILKARAALAAEMLKREA